MGESAMLTALADVMPLFLSIVPKRLSKRFLRSSRFGEGRSLAQKIMKACALLAVFGSRLV